MSDDNEQAPGLTDIYAFGDWLKKHYVGSNRQTLTISPEVGGLIRVSTLDPKLLPSYPDVVSAEPHSKLLRLLSPDEFEPIRKFRLDDD